MLYQGGFIPPICFVYHWGFIPPLLCQGFFGKDCLWQLLATVENNTNVKSYLVLFINWSNIPALSVMYQAVHNLWQTLSLLLCAQRQSLLDMNKIGLPTYQVVGVFIQTEKGLHERVPISL